MRVAFHGAFNELYAIIASMDGVLKDFARKMKAKSENKNKFDATLIIHARLLCRDS